MLKKKDKDVLLFTRRTILVGGLQALALTGLAGRMAWLQIIQGDKYKTLADKNRINVKLLAPERGIIVDRFGEAMATNDQDFRVLVTPEQTSDMRAALDYLAQIIDLKPYHIENVMDEYKKQPRYLPIEVRSNLTWEEVSRIEVNIPNLPGISTDVGIRRSYPLKNAAAHLIGYVGAANEQEIGKNHLLSLPGFKIGKNGIEKTYNDVLMGKAGRSEVEVNVSGREIRELNRKSPIAGQQVQLSIDAHLQDITQKRLGKERSASAVVMDAYTGEVYALASSPGFDPNDFTRGISNSLWEELISNQAHPLTNKAVAGQYPPGSTFKMITTLAALEHNIINANTTYHCSGQFRLGRGKFHCWRPNGHGNVNMFDALEQSCDVFFYNIATKIGINQIADMARRLGLGDKLGVEIPAERAGVIPDKEWKIGYIGKPWQPGETVVASIGQGYIQSTPLQLATMTARLINGGIAVMPSLIKSTDPAERAASFGPININKRHLAMVKKGMDRVTMGDRGTARGSRIYEAGFEMGGKTGTSQVRRITQKERDAGIKNESLPWRFRHHALFVGYAPIANPRYVCAVVVEHGGGGSTAAAPIAKELMLEVQKRNPAKNI